MKLFLHRLFRFARSPQGRHMISSAGRYARSPQGRAQIDRVRRQVAARGARRR